MFSVSWKLILFSGVFAFLLIVDLQISIFLLCFCYLYSCERVYCILFFVICKHKIPVFMFDGVVYFKFAPMFLDCHPSVLSLNTSWVPVEFHRKITFSCLIDTGVIFKPWDCICNGIVYAFDRRSWARTLPAIISVGKSVQMLIPEHLLHPFSIILEYL